MGQEIDQETFVDADFEAFERELRHELAALRTVLDRPGFGGGPDSLGIELELNLVDQQGRPLPLNRDVADRADDERIALEIDRFNVEINATPELLAGTPFRRLHDQLLDALQSTGAAAAHFGGSLAAIGILPTLVADDLTSDVLTRQKRYRALSRSLRRLRGEAFPVEIRGIDTLQVAAHDVTFEGANTSLQVHLKVPPSKFARFYNAAQAASGPLLASCCNSPTLFGRRLWHETRVALFRQAVDVREHATEDDWRPARVSFGHGWLRSDAFELFAENVVLHEPLLPICHREDVSAVLAAGEMPTLRSLRLHHGTVWRWNRAVYDARQGGHLRIEMRALPAGPSVVDMIANVAFAVGLTYGLEAELDWLLAGLTFGHARRNFYEAARLGLGAQLVWPGAARGGPELVPARELCKRLVHLAESGLERAGVAADEASRWLSVIHDRVATGVTGAAWQLSHFDSNLAEHGATVAAQLLLRRYQELALSGAPVHTWPNP